MPFGFPSQLQTLQIQQNLGNQSQWTPDQKSRVAAWDPTFNGKAPPWERGKNPAQYQEIFDIQDAVASADQAAATFIKLQSQFAGTTSERDAQIKALDQAILKAQGGLASSTESFEQQIANLLAGEQERVKSLPAPEPLRVLGAPTAQAADPTGATAQAAKPAGDFSNIISLFTTPEEQSNLIAGQEGDTLTGTKTVTLGG